MSSLRRKRKKWLFRTRRFFDFFRRNTEAVVFHGNKVTLFRHGAEFFPALLQGIAGARNFICLEFYTFCDDSTGGAVADALTAAARRGVDVFVLYDYVGCFETPTSFFKKLQKGGVHCTAFNPLFSRGLAWFDKRNHRKIAIIDGRCAFTGGVNIADTYAGYGELLQKWRDVGIMIEGEAVQELLRLFCETWDRERGFVPDGCVHQPVTEPPGEARVMVVSGGPHHERSFIRSAFRVAIAGASESITIATPYFIPGPMVIRSLLRAAGRGVRVRLLLPHKNDVPVVRLVSRTYYAQLLKSGIEIYELSAGILHAKVLLVDDCWAMVGSANLDQRSFHRNYELNVVVDSLDFGSQVAEMLAVDLRAAQRVELDEHERRGYLVRTLERLFTPVSWFL